MYADLVLKNGEIYSINESKDIYESVAIKDGYIMEVGSNDDLEALANEETEIINLNEKVVTPGIIDAHQHIISFGLNLLNVNCYTNSIEKMVEYIEEKANTLGPDEWVIGVGFDEANFIEGRMPNKDDLKHIVNPVFISRFCLHNAVVNDRALELANITEQTKVESDGKIEKDKDGLTGVLRESAVNLVQKIIPSYSDKHIRQAVKLANNHYIKEGITSVHEAGMGFYTDSLNEFTILKDMTHNREVDVRIYGMILEKFWNEMQEKNMLKNNIENDFFRIGPIKMFSDGALSSQTAAMKDNYIYPEGTKGLLMYDQDDLEEKVLHAHKSGKQIAIHAIGDAAVESVVTAFEKTLEKYPKIDHRHRIEHCGVTNQQLLNRIKKIKVIPVPHPGIIRMAGDVYKRVLNPDVLRGLYTTRSFKENGLYPALSTDCPVIPSNPLYTIYAVLTRETSKGDVIGSEEKISIYDAITMYTKHAARAAFNEDKQGTIEKGKYADFTVFPKNFMRYSPDQIKETEVKMTIINGEIKYSK